MHVVITWHRYANYITIIIIINKHTERSIKQFSYSTVVNSAKFQYVMQVRYIADCQPQYLNLRQFLIGRKGR